MVVIGEAADGKEAAQQAERHRPDIVLLDLALPGIDGLSTLRWIRESVPEAKVVVLTIHAAWFLGSGRAPRQTLSRSGFANARERPERTNGLKARNFHPAHPRLLCSYASDPTTSRLKSLHSQLPHRLLHAEIQAFP